MSKIVKIQKTQCPRPSEGGDCDDTLWPEKGKTEWHMEAPAFAARLVGRPRWPHLGFLGCWIGRDFGNCTKKRRNTSRFCHTLGVGTAAEPSQFVKHLENVFARVQTVASCESIFANASQSGGVPCS